MKNSKKEVIIFNYPFQFPYKTRLELVALVYIRITRSPLEKII